VQFACYHVTTKAFTHAHLHTTIDATPSHTHTHTHTCTYALLQAQHIKATQSGTRAHVHTHTHQHTHTHLNPPSVNFVPLALCLPAQLSFGDLPVPASPSTSSTSYHSCRGGDLSSALAGGLCGGRGLWGGGKDARLVDTACTSAGREETGERMRGVKRNVGNKKRDVRSWGSGQILTDGR
jgi:hypothetical protein